MDAPTVFLTIGPPAAGKTTFVSWELVGAGLVAPTHILSPDALLFVGDRYDWSPGRVGRAWHQVKEDFERLLETRRPLVLDATFTRIRDRAPFVKAARAQGYRVVAIFFEVPSHLLLERDRKRAAGGRRVGPEVVERFLGELEPPTEDEGFDEIWRVGPEGRRGSPPESARAGDS
jgi:predicted kinase